MNVTLERLMNQIAPWDFSIEIGGVKHATRPITLGDFAFVEKLGQEAEAFKAKRRPEDPISIQSMKEFVDGLFVEPRPDLTRVPTEALPLIIKAVTDYALERSSKKNETAPPKARPAKKEAAEGGSVSGS